MGWGRVEIERIGYGYGGICGHGLGRSGIVKGSMGLAVEKKWQRIREGRSGIMKGKAIRVVMEVWYCESCRGSCRGKEMAENRRRQVQYRERESYSCGYGGPVS